MRVSGVCVGGEPAAEGEAVVVVVDGDGEVAVVVGVGGGVGEAAVEGVLVGVSR